MTTVVLGNRHAIHSRNSGETYEPLKGKLATRVEIPEELSLADGFLAITHMGEGVWVNHFARQNASIGSDGEIAPDPEGNPKKSSDPHAPAWVASDSPAMAMLLSEHFGGIEVRELEEEK